MTVVRLPSDWNDMSPEEKIDSLVNEISTLYRSMKTVGEILDNKLSASNARLQTLEDVLREKGFL